MGYIGDWQNLYGNRERLRENIARKGKVGGNNQKGKYSLSAASARRQRIGLVELQQITCFEQD